MSNLHLYYLHIVSDQQTFPLYFQTRIWFKQLVKEGKMLSCSCSMFESADFWISVITVQSEGCKQCNHFNVNSMPWTCSSKMPSFVFWIIPTVPFVPTQILSSQVIFEQCFLYFYTFCIDSTSWLVFKINFSTKSNRAFQMSQSGFIAVLKY